jgi:acetyltransferase-like isoleucine patch superfamily enzyme
MTELAKRAGTESVSAPDAAEGALRQGRRGAWMWGVVRLWVARAGVWLLRPGLEMMIDRLRLWNHLVIGPRDRLFIHPTVVIGNAILNTSSGLIRIERDAFFGQNVLILAGTHDASLRGEERFLELPPDGHDILIEEGAWIASGAIIIGPCVVGRHAVIAAGAVVTGDVEAETMVAGIPARFIRRV